MTSYGNEDFSGMLNPWEELVSCFDNIHWIEEDEEEEGRKSEMIQWNKERDKLVNSFPSAQKSALDHVLITDRMEWQFQSRSPVYYFKRRKQWPKKKHWLRRELTACRYFSSCPYYPVAMVETRLNSRKIEYHTGDPTVFLYWEQPECVYEEKPVYYVSGLESTMIHVALTIDQFLFLQYLKRTSACILPRFKAYKVYPNRQRKRLPQWMDQLIFRAHWQKIVFPGIQFMLQYYDGFLI